jgi:HEPN domain-containing protein
MTKNEIIQYWLKTSEMDYDTMISLFRSKKYSWSLFIGHLATEKLLKAYYVKIVSTNVPRIHNLLRLAELSNLDLSQKDRDFLTKLTGFNINARYPDYKLKIYKICTSTFTEKYIKEIEKFKKWIIKKIKN